MRKRRRPLALAVLLAVVFLAVTVMRTKVNPLVEEVAIAVVGDVASNQINDAVNRQLMEGDVKYGDLVTLERDASGAIAALTTDMQELNRLKTRLLTQLDSEIYSIDQERISIPLGNLTGIELLSGRGPEIPVRIAAISSSDAQFVGQFSSAGINQTVHRIVLYVSMDLVVLLPSGTVTERVTSDVCVAETVLLGPVPDSYTYFNGTDIDTKEDALYYGAN